MTCLVAFALLTLAVSSTAAIASSSNRRAARYIRIAPSDCYDEKCYANLSDVYNSPLVECSYLYASRFTTTTYMYMYTYKRDDSLTQI